MTIKDYADLVLQLMSVGYSKDEIKDAVHELNHDGTNVFDLYPLAAAIEITRMIDLWRWMPND